MIKLKAIHVGMAVPTHGRFRDEYISVTEPKYKGATLTMTQIEGKTCIIYDHPELGGFPKMIFPENIRYAIPFPPEGEVESESKKPVRKQKQQAEGAVNA